MNVSELVAIDVHTHVHASVDDKGGAHPADDMFEYFGTDIVHPTVPHLAEHYRERKMACVAFMIDATAATGVPPQVSNEEICALAADHADVVIPFVSVDPHAGAAAVRRVPELVDHHGARGFKFHPNQQAFYPNDPEFHPLWRAMADTGLPVVFHSGHTGVGAGQPGGGHPAQVLEPDAGRRRRRRLPRDADRPRPSVVPVAGRGAVRGIAQADRCGSTCRGGRPSTSRPTSSSTRTRSSRTGCCSGPTTRSSPRTGGWPTSPDPHQGRGPAADPEGQRGRAAGARRDLAAS